MERGSPFALLLAPVLLLACSSNGTAPAPPLTSSGPVCNPPACTVVPASAAIAFVVGPDADGGACAAPFGPISLPEGAAAFDAITKCGGNRSRCGSADYRVTSEAGTSLSCSLVASDRGDQLTADVSSGGVSFDVGGTIGASGSGSAVTVTAKAADGGTFAATCTATTRVVLNGTIYADFACPGAGSPGCAPRGTFVFEGCSTE